MNGIQVGEISKQWRGCGAEMMTDTDTFKIEFPDGTDVTQKAILLGATMLVVRLIVFTNRKRGFSPEVHLLRITCFSRKTTITTAVATIKREPYFSIDESHISHI